MKPRTLEKVDIRATVDLVLGLAFEPGFSNGLNEAEDRLHGVYAHMSHTLERLSAQREEAVVIPSYTLPV
ncbi:hypothetical protein [Sagittula sp. SSi028]|uniref:hypothetical protein n=1 Tax=Sagittula sp. SSi028 TaxID=3400636 RepID=UPI003AF915B2